MSRLQYLKKIESRRLIIRPVALDDTTALYEAITASRAAMEIWQPFVRGLCLETFRQRQKQHVFYWAHSTAPVFMFVVIYKKNGKIVGAAGYNKNSNQAEKCYELTYWADTRFEGKGFITEAANLLSRYALDVLQATEVVIAMKKDNKKSRLVAKRLNFDFQGEIIGEHCPWLPKNHDRNYRYGINQIGKLPPLPYYYEEHNELSMMSMALEWALKEMHHRSIIVDIAQSTLVVQTPWSTVIRLVTSEKISYYLKIPTKGLGDEAGIFQLLRDKAHAAVPIVLAKNDQLNAFLAQDLGESLRSLLKQGQGVAYLADAARDFAVLQKNSCALVQELMEMGVPYWGLDQLTQKAAELFEQKELLIADGMSLNEYQTLRDTLPSIERLCQELQAVGLPMALVQCDFHDNNIVITNNPPAVGFIDLGEIVISHPFFSIFNFINQVKKHHPDLISQNELDNCYNKYCAVWGVTPTPSLEQPLAVLWLVYEALGQYRLYQCCDTKKLTNIQKGKLSSRLKDFIKKTEIYYSFLD